MIAHAVPGRTRLRITERQRQPAFFAEIAERLSAHPKVQQVTVNSQTGSILLRHEGEIKNIISDLPDALTLAPGPAAASTRRRAASVPPARPVPVLPVLAAGCVLLGAYQARRGRLLGTAFENVWNAYQSWRNLKTPTLAAALLGGGIAQLVRGQILPSAASLVHYAASLRQQARQAASQAGRGGASGSEGL